MDARQWNAEKRRLQGAVTRAKTTARRAESLAEKIEAKQKVAYAEEKLRLHKLNFYKLTEGSE